MPVKTPTNLLLRAATPEDMPFVKSSWFESYRHGGHAPGVAFPVYKRGMNGVIDAATREEDTVVAYLAEEPTEIIGWINQSRSYVNYVYVKQAYRRNGVATYLMSNPRPFYTHETAVGKKFFAVLGTKFDPFYIYYGGTPHAT